MELEARDANTEKQLELAPGSRATPPHRRLVLNRFSLVSVKTVRDSHWIPGARGQQWRQAGTRPGALE